MEEKAQVDSHVQYQTNRPFNVRLSCKQFKYLNTLMPLHYSLKKEINGRFSSELRMLNIQPKKHNKDACLGLKVQKLNETSSNSQSQLKSKTQISNMPNSSLSTMKQWIPNQKLHQLLKRIISRYLRWMDKDKHHQFHKRLTIIGQKVNSNNFNSFEEIQQNILRLSKRLKNVKQSRLRNHMGAKIESQLFIFKGICEEIRKEDQSTISLETGLKSSLGIKMEENNLSRNEEQENNFIKVGKVSESKRETVKLKQNAKQSKKLKARFSLKKKQKIKNVVKLQEETEEENPVNDQMISCQQAIRINQLFKKLCHFDKEKVLKQFSNKGSRSFLSIIKKKDVPGIIKQISDLLVKNGISTTFESEKQYLESSFQVSDEE